MVHSFSKSLALANTKENLDKQYADLKRLFSRHEHLRITDFTNDMDAQKAGYDWLVEAENFSCKVDAKSVLANQQKYWKDPNDPEIPIERKIVSAKGQVSAGWAEKNDECEAILWQVEGHLSFMMCMRGLRETLLTEDLYRELLVPGKKEKIVRNQGFNAVVDFTSISRIKALAPFLLYDTAPVDFDVFAAIF